MWEMGVCGGLIGRVVEVGDEEKAVMTFLNMVCVNMVEG